MSKEETARPSLAAPAPGGPFVEDLPATLRERATYMWGNHPTFTGSLLNQAANEIERLNDRIDQVEADRQSHEQAAHEADLRTQAAVRAEKEARAIADRQMNDAEAARIEIDQLKADRDWPKHHAAPLSPRVPHYEGVQEAWDGWSKNRPGVMKLDGTTLANMRTAFGEAWKLARLSHTGEAQDAARYRWMRDHDFRLEYSGYINDTFIGARGIERHLDERIDAAIAPSTPAPLIGYYCGPCNWSGELPKPKDGSPKCPECESYLSEAPLSSSAADYEEVLADHRRLVRELDVLLNGEAGAAKQASLCDIVAQVRTQRSARVTPKNMVLVCATCRFPPSESHIKACDSGEACPFKFGAVDVSRAGSKP